MRSLERACRGSVEEETCVLALHSEGGRGSGLFISCWALGYL